MSEPKPHSIVQKAKVKMEVLILGVRQEKLCFTEHPQAGRGHIVSVLQGENASSVPRAPLLSSHNRIIFKGCLPDTITRGPGASAYELGQEGHTSTQTITAGKEDFTNAVK